MGGRLCLDLRGELLSLVQVALQGTVALLHVKPGGARGEGVLAREVVHAAVWWHLCGVVHAGANGVAHGGTWGQTRAHGTHGGTWGRGGVP